MCVRCVLGALIVAAATHGGRIDTAGKCDDDVVKRCEED